MIYSKSHKFLFLHVPKTGGKSVYQTLGDISIRVCGNHTSIASAREFVGQGQFRKYFTFSFVRNPWDRMVSMYEYNRRKKTFKKSFEDFVNFRLLMKQKHLQNRWIVEGGKLVVNFLGRYENFQEDFNTVCEKIGISHRTLKEIGRSKRGPYQSYYSDDTKDAVAKLFKDDIEIFGYEYEN